MWGHGVASQVLVYTKLPPSQVFSDADMMVTQFINFTIESFEYRKLRALGKLWELNSTEYMGITYVMPILVIDRTVTIGCMLAPGGVQAGASDGYVTGCPQCPTGHPCTDAQPTFRRKQRRELREIEYTDESNGV
jgi:hypothetical protein